jgi:hypothetical protein
MRRNIFFIILFSFISLFSFAQPALVAQIDALNTPMTGLEPLRVLASDELMGRGTLRPEIHIAARYIGEEFRAAGLKEVPGTNDYFQSFTIQMITRGKTGSIQLGATHFDIGKDWVQTSGKDIMLSAPVIYLHHGSKKDFDNTDVRGKIIVTDMGSVDSSTFMDGFYLMETKQQWASDKGALALIERFTKAEVPWDALAQYAGSERPSINEADIPTMIIRDSASPLPALLKGGVPTASITMSGTQIKNVPAKNVLGWIEGTDPVLKNEFLLLSAHYDHLGLAAKPEMQDGKLDSIYNGARDNAIGSAAIIDAARYFSKYPTKRSIVFITYTAEEIGLIGSKYFADHPPIPLDKIKYDLNIDNASYNDTTIVSVIGLGRTSADKHIEKACAAFGLSAYPDPAPDLNLFDRSDNVSVAAMGIPAPTFSLGMRKFDDEVNKRYHQLSDEVGNFNLRYAMKYINAFILAAFYIANDPVQPSWVKGDKYEPQWKALYKK